MVQSPKGVILRKRSASKNLRTEQLLSKNGSAKILRLRAMPSAQDDAFLKVLQSLQEHFQGGALVILAPDSEDLLSFGFSLQGNEHKVI